MITHFVAILALAQWSRVTIPPRYACNLIKDGGFNDIDSHEDHEKWSYARYIWKKKPTEFTEGSKIGLREKSYSTLKNSCHLLRRGNFSGNRSGGRIGDKIRSLVLNIPR